MQLLTQGFGWRRARPTRAHGKCKVMLACLLLGVGAMAVPGARAAPQVVPDAGAPSIMLSGVPAGSPVARKIIAEAWQQALAKAGSARALTDADWQQLLSGIDTALAKAGFAQAHAFRSTDLAVFMLPGSASGQVTAVVPTAERVPPVSDRGTEAGVKAGIEVRGFVVQGVGDHPEQGITPASIKQLANAQLAKLGGGQPGQPVTLDFMQLQAVADAITTRYRKAGFIVATAYLPAQTVADDGLIHLQVLEGSIGRILVKGADHYHPWVISASTDELRGQVLRKDAVNTALRYDRDLPGVSVSATFQPGQNTGQTDLLLLAREKAVPLELTVGASNYGTPATGRYRLDAKLDWLAPLGLGDQLSLGVSYSLVPHQNNYGSIQYDFPFVKVPGLGLSIGSNRSELELKNGAFAALQVKGPTSRYFGGLHWKFANSEDLSMTASLRYIREKSKLSAQNFLLSNQRFDVARLSLSMRHTDRRFNGIDALHVSVRKSLKDESLQPDLVSPDHADDFFVTTLDYTRIQFLTPTQNLLFKFSGQYTNDRLVPMEQFGIGGPYSVRAYPIAMGLTDRGLYTSLAYRINAPGFADTPSPFHGVPWRNLLTVQGFVDYARGFPVATNGLSGGKPVTFSGAGLGVIFRLPHWNNLLFQLDAAVPLDSQESNDEQGVRFYGRFELTF